MKFDTYSYLWYQAYLRDIVFVTRRPSAEPLFAVIRVSRLIRTIFAASRPQPANMTTFDSLPSEIKHAIVLHTLHDDYTSRYRYEPTLQLYVKTGMDEYKALARNIAATSRTLLDEVHFVIYQKLQEVDVSLKAVGVKVDHLAVSASWYSGEPWCRFHESLAEYSYRAQSYKDVLKCLEAVMGMGKGPGESYEVMEQPVPHVYPAMAFSA